MATPNQVIFTGRTEQKVQFVLRLGLAIAFVFMLVGVLIKVGSNDWTAPAIVITSIFDGSLGLGDRMLSFGILLLSLTPIFRVVALLVFWVQEKDWFYVAVCLAVIFVLILSVLVGEG